MAADETIRTERLELPPLSAAAIAALIEGDGGRLGELTGAVWPEPVAAPPLMADALPFFAARLWEEPEAGAWWARLLVLRQTGQVVGSAGLAGRPAADGGVSVGYAVYPAFEGRGYAAEAVRGIVGWAFGQPGVARVRATIPPGHAASQRVAAKAGLRRVGTVPDEELGEVEVWEIGRGEGGE